MNFFVKEYGGNAAANFRMSALTDPINDGPQDGYYWEVFHFTVWDSDSNGQNMALYLFDGASLSALQSAIIAGANQGYVPDFTAVTGGAIPIPAIHKIAPGEGLPSAAAWGIFESQRLGGGSIHHNGALPKIYIPAKWGLYCVETNSVVSAIGRQMLMRFCYRQFKNGCSPNSGW